MRYALACALGVGSLVALAAGGCGAFSGDEGGTSPSDAGDGAPADGSPAPDAAADAEPANDGAAARTRSVKCNGKACTGTDACCVPPDMTQSACTGNCSDKDSLALYCDDTADCPDGKVCCIDFDPATPTNIIGVTCQSTCSAGSERACDPAVETACDCAPLATVRDGGSFPAISIYACR